MSIKQMTAVFKDTSLKGNEKLLMLAIADNANDSGVAFPSWNTIMEKTSMGRNTLSKWLKVLEEKGMLFRKQRSRENGSKTSNKFLIYPYENKSSLDYEDISIFEDLFTTVPKEGLGKEHTQSTKIRTTTVPKEGLGNIPKVPKDVLLEPSLNNLTITINHHLDNMTQNEVSLFNEYLDIRKSIKVQTTDAIKLRLLQKYFKFGRNQQVIESAINANWKDFYEPKQQKQQQPYNTPKSQTLNTDVNIWDEIEKQGNDNKEFIK